MLAQLPRDKIVVLVRMIEKVRASVGGNLTGVTVGLWGLTFKAKNLALGRENGTVELNISGDFWENSIVTPGSTGGSGMITVPSATFQALIEKANRKINVLIVDIEGAEQFIDFDQIPANIDKIIIELHPQCIGQEMTYNLIARIIGNGFRVAREDNLTFAFLRK